jgi:EpsI family protein
MNAPVWAFRQHLGDTHTSPLGRFVLAGLLLVIAYPTLTSLMLGWEQNPDYGHGWLLLPALAWLFWKRKTWHYASTPEPWLGCITMLAGGLLHVSTIVVPWPLVDYFAWLLLLRGLALTLWGRSGASHLMPILAFGILLFPLPMVWLNQLALLLQNIISILCEWMLGCFWVCLRRGPLLQLAGMDSPVSVAVECSGVRQLLVFLALAWFLALHLHGPWWKKLLFTLASLPIAILANVLRVLALVIIAKHWGASSIDGLLHEMPLVITLPAGAVILWWLFQLLQQPSSRPVDLVANPTRVSLRWPLIIAGLLLTLQLALQYHLSNGASPYQIDRLSLDALPLQLGSWQGATHPESERITKQANFADATLLRTYSNATGQAVSIYLVFSATGRDRLHHPEICLRDAGGAAEWKPGQKLIALDDKRSIERLCYERQRHQRTTVYYWHYSMAPPRSQDQSLLQRLHWMQNDRFPSLTVQVQTNTVDAASWQAIEQSLLPELDRWLLSQMPSGVQTGAHRLPIRFTLLR